MSETQPTLTGAGKLLLALDSFCAKYAVELDSILAGEDVNEKISDAELDRILKVAQLLPVWSSIDRANKKPVNKGEKQTTVIEETKTTTTVVNEATENTFVPQGANPMEHRTRLLKEKENQFKPTAQ